MNCVKFLDPLRRKFASPRRDLGSRGFYGSVSKQNEMAKNAFGFHKQRFLIESLPSVGRETESRTQSPTHQGACFPADGETISRHACGSMTADYEVLQRLWLLLLHHGAAEHGPSRGVVGLHVSNLVSTIANYEEATYRCPK